MAYEVYELDEVVARGDYPTIDRGSIRDLRPEALDSDGRIQVLPAAFWAATTPHERALFGANTGIYSYPTVELVERLREIIAGRSAIEIGSGHGVLAGALGIPGTDSFLQRTPEVRALLQRNGLKAVPYGASVIDMHASRAVRHFKPQVVIGAWVTHKFIERERARGGSEQGIDEPDVLHNCETYVLVGHEHTHLQARIFDRTPPPEVEYPSFVFSRALQPGRDFIAIVNGARANGH